MSLLHLSIIFNFHKIYSLSKCHQQRVIFPIDIEARQVAHQCLLILKSLVSIKKYINRLLNSEKTDCASQTGEN